MVCALTLSCCIKPGVDPGNFERKGWESRDDHVFNADRSTKSTTLLNMLGFRLEAKCNALSLKNEPDEW